MDVITADGVTKKQSPVLTEVPVDLQRLLLTLVKNFYGFECYVVFDYIMKKVILKEDELRDVCKIDQRQLRKFLATLKVDKFVKERLVPEEVDGKVRKFTYYFVNYKGALNVTKYKIDHIRQKLEVREKDDVHRAHYRCSNELCKRQYDAMDMGKIFDPFSQEMRCWQCKSLVEQDVSSGPSQITRSSMANFNEQMTVIFSLLKLMDGVRFGREITEPAIQAPIPKLEGETIELEARKVANLGQRPFSAAGRTRTDLYGGEITVSIGDDNFDKASHEKAEIPWLLASHQQKEEVLITTATTSEFEQNQIEQSQKIEELILTAENGAPVQKRPRQDEIATLLAEEEYYEMTIERNNDEIDEEQRMEIQQSFETKEQEVIAEESNDFVRIQGELVHIDNIDEQQLARMSEEEKADYYERMQGAYADFY